MYKAVSVGRFIELIQKRLVVTYKLAELPHLQLEWTGELVSFLRRLKHLNSLAAKAGLYDPLIDLENQDCPFSSSLSAPLGQAATCWRTRSIGAFSGSMTKAPSLILNTSGSPWTHFPLWLHF